MPNHIHAQANVEDMLRAQAVRTAVALIKKRVARHLIMSERDLPRRWFGAGGEISLMNAKAVLLYGRAICRASSLRA